MANAWGNIDYGYREVGSGTGYTDVEAYAFDKETNTRSCRTFRVLHKRSSHGRLVDLSDPRDVYELVANQASRRIRACILQVIPGDITEAALKSCEETIKRSGGDAPLVDRVRKMATVFQDYGVTTEMLERKLGHKLDVTIEQELIQLRRIYTSIKDGAAKRDDFFDFAMTNAATDVKPAAKQTEPDPAPAKPAEQAPAADAPAPPETPDKPETISHTTLVAIESALKALGAPGQLPPDLAKKYGTGDPSELSEAEGLEAVEALKKIKR
jgi:hypothetical protein